MKNQANLTEKEVLKVLETQPSLVQIKGNRNEISLSYQNLCVAFPVREHIYTRWVCSLADAQVLSSNQTLEVSPAMIQALAQAAESKKHSSFDLKFQ